jgi:hypothetical protein
MYGSYGEWSSFFGFWGCLLGFVDAQDFGHFFVSEALTWPVGLDPFAVDD